MVQYLTASGLDVVWEAEEIEGALSAERAAQARDCAVPQDYPDDLREALLRRVAHNLAMRKLPLGIAGDGIDALRVSSRDPEVYRLERKWPRLGGIG
jgi:hypothetical protein